MTHDPATRKRRLKAVFEGRCAQLDAARLKGDQQAYGRAVVAYIRARTAWRAFRGWPPQGGSPWPVYPSQQKED